MPSERATYDAERQPVNEMADLITATRAYEADTTAIKAVEGRHSTPWT